RPTQSPTRRTRPAALRNSMNNAAWPSGLWLTHPARTPDRGSLLRARRERELADGRCALLVEGVARSAHGADRIAIAVRHERLAQAPDMHINGAPVDEVVAAPHPVEQLLARQHAPAVLHEEGEQAKLGRPEAHLAVASGHAMCSAVEDDVAPLQNVGDAT